jgi:uncharacterized protein (DUF305 family)
MNEKRRNWIIAAIIGVALLLIASFTTANWYRSRSKASNPKTNTESISNLQATVFNRNLDNVSAEDAVNRYLLREREITNHLLKELKNTEVSGNGSMDYLKGMLSLNEAAMLLSESYLSSGSNNEPFKLFAQQTITALQDEMGKIKGLNEKYAKEEHKNEDMENAYLTDFNTLVSELEQAEKTDSSSLEHAYAGALICYDQMAVDMATSIQEYTDYNEIMSLAQKIINERKPQIDELKKLAP